MRVFFLAFMAGACLLMGACSSGMKAGLITLQQEVMPTRQDVRQSPLQPGVRYLLVEERGQEALLVWVGTEQGPLGETTVWTSADGVIVRLVQGRLVGVAEPLRTWRLTSETAFAVANTSQFRQRSDVQPGYRMGLVRTIEKKIVPSVPRPMPWVEENRHLNWIEEVDVSTGQRLAIVAVNEMNQTIAGQRCISPQWCLRWQAWPANPPRPPA